MPKLSEAQKRISESAEKIWQIALDSWDLNVDLGEEGVITYQSAWKQEFIERVTAKLGTLLRIALAENTDLQVEAQGKRLDILEGKAKQPIDRRLVGEALAICQRFDSWIHVRDEVDEIQDLLRCALEGDSDARD